MAIACSACSYVNPDHARFCAGCGARLGQAGAERDPLFGQLIHDRYRIVRVIGEGGMGRVYYAEQQMGTAKRPVAIKVLRGGQDSVGVSRFTRECELVVQLTHPSTIRFYDFGKLPDGRLYIAMEYVEGRSLAGAIDEGPMPLATVERLVGQIGGALIEAHRRGIVHRDLKPDNILLAHNPDEGEFAKVLDFGIAKQNESHGGTGTEITSEGLIVGTPAYMSPEQLSAKPLDERSDVYALALIVFEMLTGRRPFEAKTPLEWATAHISKPVPSFDEFAATRLLPESKRAAILHALAKEPHDRTHSVRAFLEEFLGAQRMSVLSIAPSSDREPRPAGDAPTLAATPSARGARSDAETPRVPTRRTPLVILGAVVMAGVGAALVFAFRDRLVGAPPLTTVSDAGVSVLDAGTDAAVPEPTWLRIMSGSDRTTDVARALGPPDGECARIAPGGKVLLELAPGTRIHTDGRASADLSVVVGETSAPYRVDVLRERGEERTQVGADVVGSVEIDVDQFERAEFRYVRVKNPNRRGDVCLDAVAIVSAQAS
jgi:serine/threonine protein kinase